MRQVIVAGAVAVLLLWLIMMLLLTLLFIAHLLLFGAILAMYMRPSLLGGGTKVGR